MRKKNPRLTLSQEYRYKNSKQNISKLNPVTYEGED